MVCKNCGQETDGSTRFCINCGADLSAEAEAAAPAKKKGLVKIIVIAAAAVVVIAAIVIAALAFFGGGSHKVEPLYAAYLDGTYYVTSDGKNVTKLDGSGNIRYSLYRNALCHLSEDGELSIWRKGELERIASDVEDYTMSADGSAVVYLKDEKLSIYKNGKTESIAKDIPSMLNVCVAPDGSAVGYVLTDDDGDDTGYIWKGSKSVDIGEDKYPVAISAGCKYVYYEKAPSYSTYVMKGTDTDSKVKLSDGTIDYLNADGTEAYFATDDKTSISVGIADAVKISSEYAEPILPGNTTAISASGRSGSFVNVSTFAGNYYMEYGESRAIYVNDKLEDSSVVKNAYNFFVDDSGRTLFYMKGDSIRKIDGTDPDAEAVTLVDEEADDFVISGDGKMIYYVDDDGDIYAQKGTNKAVRIGSDVYRIEMFEGKTLFFLTDDDELYRSQGSKAEKVTAFKGDPVSINVGPGYVVVKTDDDGDVCFYFSNDGKEFFLIAEE